MLKATMAAVLMLSSLVTYADQPEYSTLKSSRSSLNLPHYSVEQKEKVLSQARLILTDIYVHRELKIKDFGQAADPIPALDAIEKQIGTISDLDFHKLLSDVFVRLHDLHTLYYLPKPFACSSSFLPFNVQEVRAADGKKVIAVAGVRTDNDVIKFMPQPFPLKKGDIITSYDGVSVEEAIQSKLADSLGANPSAMRRKSVQDLRIVEHDLEFLPKKDSVVIEFKNNKGEKYKLDIPWIVYTDWNCVAADQGGAQNNLIVKPVSPIKREIIKPLKDKIIKIKNPTSARINISKGFSGTAQGHTDEPILYWQINHSVYGNFGYIELVSFDPETFTVSEVVNAIKNLLLNELKNTDGLMFDLRGNPGGQLPLAERLVQFFSPRKVRPSSYILRNSETNAFYMNTTDSENPFTKALNDVRGSGSAFTRKLPIDAQDTLNDVGQVYFKPLAVFVDADCYSACDTFSAQIQDHMAGTIFGEDQTTGGGGANVYGLNKILNDFVGQDTGPFKRLDHGQNIIFAFRQAFRRGIHEGVRIEDAGITVDRISAPAMSDLFNATNDQLLVLQKFLKEESVKYTSNMYFTNEARMDFVINKPATFNASWNDTEALEFKVNGKALEKRTISNQGSSNDIAIPTSVATNEISEGRLEVFGSKNQKNTWRKILNYRIIPESKILTQDLALSLKDESEMGLYTMNTLKKDGWHISDGSLYIGDGKQYANLSEAEASLFVTLQDAAYELKFDAVVKTEAKFDYLKVVGISEGVETILLDKVSGDVPLTNYKLDLSSFRGKSVELRFIFESDEGTYDQGVTIKNISINQKK